MNERQIIEYVPAWHATDAGLRLKLIGEKSLGGAGYYVEEHNRERQSVRLVSGPWATIERAELIAASFRDVRAAREAQGK